MKVLAAVVVPPHLSVSGAARAAERLTDELARDPELEIDLATMADPAGAPTPSASDGPRARRLPVRVSNPLSFTARALPNRFRTLFYRSDIPRLVRSGRYDLVHIHNPTPGLEMQRVARAARRAGTPYVVSTHGFVEIADGAQVNGLGTLARNAWKLLAHRPVCWVVHRAAMVLILSPSDATVVDRLEGRGVATALVPNGVDAVHEQVEPHDPEPHEGEQQEGEPAPSEPGALKAFFLANHTPNKGLPVLLEAFERLPVPFSLVVGGAQRDFVDYERWASDRPDRRITFTGPLSDAEVDDLFGWADVFVFPTLADTLPLVVLEAMAHGTPVIASDVGGIPYELEGGCGVLVPPGDPSALADAVEKVALDPEGRARMGRSAAERVATEFTWAAAADAAEGAYRRVVGEDARGDRRPAA